MILGVPIWVVVLSMALGAVFLCMQALCEGRRFPEMTKDNLFTVLLCALIIPVFSVGQKAMSSFSIWKARRKRRKLSEQLEIKPPAKKKKDDKPGPRIVN